MSKRANGEGGVRKRRDGRWEATLTVGYNADGGQNRKYFYGKTRAEALAKLNKALRALEEGTPLADDSLMSGKFLTQWLEESVKPNVRPSTYARSEQVVRLHLKPVIGRVKLTKLSPQDVQSLLTAKLASGLSPRSVQIIHATLRCALNQALRWGIVNRNVAQLVRPPRGSSKRVEPLTPQEVRVFLGACRGDRLEALFVVAVASGLRKAELLGLRWEDLDLEKATLHVEYTMQRVNGVYLLGEPKTKQSRRTIMIPQVAVAALRAHKARQAAERLAAGPEWDEWGGLVFTTDRGQPLNGCVLSVRFKKILEEAGLRTQRLHDLRHSCATILLTEGLNPKLVQEHLGHANVSTTMAIYAHSVPELRGETATRMDALLSAK